MTNMLLDLSRIESGQMALQLSTVCTKEVIGHVLNDLQPLAEKKAITVQAEELVDVPVRADRHKLEQVILNLVHNAIKFTPERGHLLVRSDVTKDHRLTITVADTGCGIPREHHEKVFEKFHRAPSPVQEGSGLGLAITRKLVELQGGTISLDSEPGRGSRFFVSLPQAAAQRHAPR
jgi:signal transduction histidine kinase